VSTAPNGGLGHATDSGERELKGAADGEKIGVPVLLLIERPLSGPWRVEEIRGVVTLRHGDGRVAFRQKGGRYVAERLAERLNGWEVARDFCPGTGRYVWPRVSDDRVGSGA
jgi:hypothetical protein